RYRFAARSVSWVQAAEDDVGHIGSLTCALLLATSAALSLGDVEDLCQVFGGGTRDGEANVDTAILGTLGCRFLSVGDRAGGSVARDGKQRCSICPLQRLQLSVRWKVLVPQAP